MFWSKSFQHSFVRLNVLWKEFGWKKSFETHVKIIWDTSISFDKNLRRIFTCEIHPSLMDDSHMLLCINFSRRKTVWTPSKGFEKLRTYSSLKSPFFRVYLKDTLWILEEKAKPTKQPTSIGYIIPTKAFL